jgi:hypothetical protein
VSNNPVVLQEGDLVLRKYERYINWQYPIVRYRESIRKVYSPAMLKELTKWALRQNHSWRPHPCDL